MVPSHIETRILTITPLLQRWFYHLIERIIPSLKLEIKIFWTAIVAVINMLGMAPAELRKTQGACFYGQYIRCKELASWQQSWIWIGLASTTNMLPSYRVFLLQNVSIVTISCERSLKKNGILTAFILLKTP